MHHGLIFLLIFLAVGVGLKGPLLLMKVITRRRSSLKAASEQESEIRAVDCGYCGYHVEGADDGELFDQLQIHIDRDHPDLRVTDQEIDEIVASEAYEPDSAQPPRD